MDANIGLQAPISLRQTAVDTEKSMTWPEMCAAVRRRGMRLKKSISSPGPKYCAAACGPTSLMDTLMVGRKSAVHVCPLMTR